MNARIIKKILEVFFIFWSNIFSGNQQQNSQNISMNPRNVSVQNWMQNTAHTDQCKKVFDKRNGAGSDPGL